MGQAVDLIYWYLIAGTVYLSAMYTIHKVKKILGKDVHSHLSVLHRRDGAWYMVLLDFFLTLLIIASWPALLYCHLKDVINPYTPPTDPVFEVQHEHLIRMISVDEVEEAETIIDPLEAAPRIPFGHLNSVWTSFRDGISPGDELWSFSAEWCELTNKETYQGYAILRGGKLFKFIIATSTPS